MVKYYKKPLPGISKLKKGVSYSKVESEKIFAVNNAFESAEEFGDAFMLLHDFIRLCMTKIRFHDIQMDLIHWGTMMHIAWVGKDKDKFDLAKEEYLFRLKLVLPIDKFDLLTPKYDQFFLRSSKSF